METPASSKTFTLELTPKLSITATFDNRAEYRMSTLERPFEFSDFKVKRRSWGALVAWVWACLGERDALNFPTPESLAPYLKDEKIVGKAFDELLASYRVATQEPKNLNG